MKKIIFPCTILFAALLVISGCVKNINFSKPAKPLYVNTTGGLVVIDLEQTKINSESIKIGKSIFAIGADGDAVYLSDSSSTTYSGNDLLYILSLKKKYISKLEAPNVDNLIVKNTKVYGLADNTLLFVFDKTKKTVKRFKMDDQLNLAGFIEKEPILVVGNKLKRGEKKQLLFHSLIDQVFIWGKGNKKQIIVAINDHVYSINPYLLKIKKRLLIRPKPLSEKFFLYKDDLFYPSNSTEDGKFYEFSILNLTSGRIKGKIILPSEPSKVISANHKLYFTISLANNSYLRVIDTSNLKAIKNILVAENPSGEILIDGKIYVASPASKTISIIDVSNDRVVKTIKLKYDPTTFATSLPSVVATDLGL